MGFDRVVEAIGDRTRRQVLTNLVEQQFVELETPLGGDDAQLEAPLKRDGAPATAAEIRLLHLHLPKLDDMGYVVWDQERRTVLKGPNWEEIEPVIRLLQENRHQLPDDAF